MASHAPLPKEAQSDYGHRLAALVAFLTVTCRMPRRVVESVLELVLEIPISLGSTQKLWEEAGDAVEAFLPATGTATGAGSRAECGRQRLVLPTDCDAASWCSWQRSLFATGQWRAITGEVLVSLLGAAFAGVLCSDRGSEYRKYRRKHPGLIQYCWSHLKRNIQAVLDFATTEEGKHFCRDTLAIYARVFRLWHQFRRKCHRPAPQLMEKVIRLEKKLFFLAECHLDSA